MTPQGAPETRRAPRTPASRASRPAVRQLVHRRLNIISRVVARAVKPAVMSYFRQARPARSAQDFEHIEGLWLLRSASIARLILHSDWRQEEGGRWLCLVCPDATPRKLADALEHERRAKHVDARRQRQTETAPSPRLHSHDATGSAPFPHLPAAGEHESGGSLASWLSGVPSSFSGGNDILEDLLGSFRARVASANEQSDTLNDDHEADNNTSLDTDMPEAFEPYEDPAILEAAERLERDLLRRAHRDDPEVDFSSDDDVGEVPLSDSDDDEVNMKKGHSLQD